jgi:hypothetical protein
VIIWVQLLRPAAAPTWRDRWETSDIVLVSGRTGHGSGLIGT